MCAVEISNRGRRRSPRLLEREQSRQKPSRPGSPGSRPAIPAATSRPRERVPAFIVEYKAPHKLTTKATQEGLRDMALEDVLDYGESDTPRRKYQRLVAAAVTQAFIHGVSRARIWICVHGSGTHSPAGARKPGNGTILPAAPHGRGPSARFQSASSSITPAAHEWRAKAEASLATWECMYKDILDDAPAPEETPSEYCPTPDNGLLRVSPIALRQSPVPRGRVTCGKPSRHQVRDDDSNADHSNPDNPSQPSRIPTTRVASSKEKREKQWTRAFCTQRCFLGLINGGNLDRGATLASHGYTVIAKCTPLDFVSYLQHEATIYDRLRIIQGHCVPVYLGNLDLDLERPYYYEGTAELVNVMFLGYGGTPVLWQLRELDQNRALGQVEECLRAIHERGVLHRDVMPRKNTLGLRQRPSDGDRLRTSKGDAESPNPGPVIGQPQEEAAAWFVWQEAPITMKDYCTRGGRSEG
ncbi:hypothetical protein Q7P37_003037 [Cladosporium fusiforme]